MLWVGRDVRGRYVSRDHITAALLQPGPTTVRVYLDRHLSTWATVDAADAQELREWTWRVSQGFKRKPYARGVVRIGGRPRDVYMHRWLMATTPPPSPEHTMVDHLNGNGLDNRRQNLRWVTPAENRANISYYYRPEFIERTTE
jgi:hypothetical protein